MKLRRKGFTIVELVIVIAVVAVLAAILIPTFANLTKRANLSADQQAIVQINKILTMEAVEKKLKIGDVHEVLEEHGYGDYTPYIDGALIYWIEEDNVVVLVENGKVIYPEKYQNTTKEMTLLFGKGLLPETHFNKSEDGKGTQAEPYVVNDSADMLYIGKMVQSGNTLEDTYFKLDTDMTLTDWVAVGEQSYGTNGHVIATTPFSGTFDGNGKTITLTSAKDGNPSGLFSAVKNATIKSLTLNVNIDSDDVAGGLVALVDLRYGTSTTIEDVTVNGTIVTSSTIAGGIIGNTNATYGESKDYDGPKGTITLKNLVNNATVTSTYSNDYDVKVGGIVGQTSTMNVVIENCENNGTLTAGTYGADTKYRPFVGGIVGMHQGGDLIIKNSKNTANMTGTVKGSLIGVALNGGYIEIQDSSLTNIAETIGQLNRSSAGASTYQIVINDKAYVTKCGGKDANDKYIQTSFAALYNGTVENISEDINLLLDLVKYVNETTNNAWSTDPKNAVEAFDKGLRRTEEATGTPTLFKDTWQGKLDEYNTAKGEDYTAADFEISGWHLHVLYEVDVNSAKK